MHNIYHHLLDIRQKGSLLALATVTRTIGSTPQKPGSSALFDLKGLVAGTVGGGVLEGEVQQIAQRAIRLKESGYYPFKLDGEISHGDGAICGGQAGILIDASPEDHVVVFESVKQSMINRTPGILVTIVTVNTDRGTCIQRFWLTGIENQTIPFLNDPVISGEVQRLLSAGKPGDYRELDVSPTGDEHKDMVLLEAIFPPPHLVIAGAGHIGRALSHIGKLLDFEITVIDDRPEYANPANLPDADHILVMDIGSAMEQLEKSPDTFVVILTRGHKDDARALKACIGADMAYIGMIGSKRKITQMQKDFLEHGWAAPEEWDLIHAPVGLDIRSVSVQEIAISIAAQLILVKNSNKPA